MKKKVIRLRTIRQQTEKWLIADLGYIAAFLDVALEDPDAIHYFQRELGVNYRDLRELKNVAKTIGDQVRDRTETNKKNRKHADIEIGLREGTDKEPGRPIRDAASSERGLEGNARGDEKCLQEEWDKSLGDSARELRNLREFDKKVRKDFGRDRKRLPGRSSLPLSTRKNVPY